MVLATMGPARVKGGRTNPADQNVGAAERALSVVGGGALAAYGLRRRGLPGMTLALIGLELLRRGTTGHCHLYSALGLTSANADGSSTLPHRARDVTGRAATVNARKAVKIERSVSVQGNPAELFSIWRDFSNLPRFMTHIESVERVDEMHSHWVARGPGGRTIEWDAEIVNEIPGELVAWKTVGDPDVAHAGSVHFRRVPAKRDTEVRLVLDYEPPAFATIGAIAKLFGHVPDTLIRDDLRRFKQLVESGELATAEARRPLDRQEPTQLGEGFSPA